MTCSLPECPVSRSRDFSLDFEPSLLVAMLVFPGPEEQQSVVDLHVSCLHVSCLLTGEQQP